MPTELELIALKTEFDLYLGFVKRLVLDLPNSEDRTLAALWLQKLRSITKDEQMKLRNEHLKLFLFALHRRSLVGPFEKKPPKDELETFHDGITLLEMTRELIEITERKKTEGKKEGEEGFGVCPLPPVRTSFSYDLKEYAACQEIPKFGSHVYYAVSSEPIQLWTKAAGQSYPEQHEAPNQLQWEISMAKICDHVLEKEAELDKKLDAEKQTEVFDAAEQEPEEKQQQPDIKTCGPKSAEEAAAGFKWKPDSKLLIYQTYDFSDVGVAEDLVGQGKHQLELDEHALNILDESLPGRQRVHIRVPYYQGLPPDFIERRHHGVYEEIPDEEECDGPPCEDDEEEDCYEEDEASPDGDGSNEFDCGTSDFGQQQMMQQQYCNICPQQSTCSQNTMQQQASNTCRSSQSNMMQQQMPTISFSPNVTHYPAPNDYEWCNESNQQGDSGGQFNQWQDQNQMQFQPAPQNQQGFYNQPSNQYPECMCMQNDTPFGNSATSQQRRSTFGSSQC